MRHLSLLILLAVGCGKADPQASGPICPPSNPLCPQPVAAAPQPQATPTPTPAQLPMPVPVTIPSAAVTPKAKAAKHHASGDRSQPARHVERDDEDNHSSDGRSVGATCEWNSDCESGNCNFRKCAPPVGDSDYHEAGKSVGEPCEWNSDCASNNCNFRKCGEAI